MSVPFIKGISSSLILMGGGIDLIINYLSIRYGLSRRLFWQRAGWIL